MPMSWSWSLTSGLWMISPEQIDVVARENLGRGVGQVDRALDAVTKAECLRELDGEAVGREVRLGVAQVLDDRAAVVAFDLFLHELHDLRGAKIDLAGGVDGDGHPLINRQRAGGVKGM